MNDVSVILVDDSPVASAIERLIIAWAACGLVRDSVWVTPSNVVEEPSGPPRVMCRVIGPSGIREDDLFKVLGTRRVTLVRLVVLHLLLAGGGSDDRLTSVGDRLARLLPSALPQTTGENDGGTRLHRIKLLVPVSGTSGIRFGLLRRDWEVNAVVAPEDRPDLDRASIFVRYPGNYAGHAAASTCTTGGLWVGVPVGSVDHLQPDFSTDGHDLAVLRHSVRAVIGDHLPRQLADAAMTAVSTDRSGAAGIVTWANRAVDPDLLAARAMERIRLGEGWAPPDAASGTSDPLRAEWGVRAAFSDAARFNIRLVAVGAGWLVGRGRRAVEHLATSLTAGGGADYVVRMEPRHPEEILRLAEVRLNVQAHKLRQEMFVGEAAAISPPQPQMWQELRRICFGLADGSALPEGMGNVEVAGMPQLIPPAVVVPDPLDGFRSGADHIVRPCDAVEAFALRTRLATIGPQMLEDPALEDPALEDSAFEVPALEDPARDDAQLGDEVEDEQAEARRKELAGLDAWVGRRQGSVLWELARDTSDRIAASKLRADTAFKQAVADQPPAVEKVRRAQATLIHTWTVVAVVLMVAMTACVCLSWFYGRIWAYVGGTALLVSVPVVMVANHGFYRAVRRYEWSVANLLSSHRRTAEEYIAARREANRLSMLYGHLMDWAEIIGWIIHHPWRPELERTPPDLGDALDGLPAAVAVAVPTDSSSDLPARHVTAAADILCARGWVSRCFDRIVEQTESGTETLRGSLSVDLDAQDALTSPRRSLLTRLADGSARDDLTEVARERIRHAIGQEALEVPARMVRRIGAYGDVDEDLTDSQFFAATMGPAAPLADDAWTDSGLHQRRHLVSESKAWIPMQAGAAPDEALTVFSTAGDAAVRVDLARDVDHADVRLFEPAAVIVPAAHPEGVTDWN